ncbi:MAG TPA: cytochrome c oxidase subunit II [Solirubrobacteraceae bacterium]|nr:cytochrome c oxidase subunit II [Solirubrobacteraceae bacterium]
MTGARVSTAAALVSTHHNYDRLFSIYVPIGLGILAFIALGMPVVALIFRRRPPERAARWHEQHMLEGTYAVLLVAVVAFLLWKTFGVEHQVDTVANQEKGGVTIKVVASRWEWSFYYPRYHITVRSGWTGDQAFVVPVNQPIHFYLTSVDVIHSFWIPALDYKHDNFPGATQEVTLTFTNPGTFPGQCAEFCGFGHSEMVFDARAVSSARFAAWAASGGRAPA